jgi:D-tyrosyl-tRNA(Tyr) deacylase
MRALIQRVTKASVSIEGRLHSRTGQGLLIFLGIEHADTNEDVQWLSAKIAALRIFNDAEGKMNRSITDINGECMLVSQFTLHASTLKGNRPSFIRSARPEQAIPLYEAFRVALQLLCNRPVQTGVFGADMQIELLNDGPVSIWIDSRNRE